MYYVYGKVTVLCHELSPLTVVSARPGWFSIISPSRQDS